MKNEPLWLTTARELQMIGQAGLVYCKDEYDRDRFRRILVMSAAMFAQRSGEPKKKVERVFLGENGYLTPKIDVRGAVFKDNKILLVREIADEGKWTLPGGWADINHTPSENVEKEILEETGLVARATKVAAVYDRTKQGHLPEQLYTYKIFFICDITSGSLQTSFETGESRFFVKKEIPQEAELSVRRVRRSQILRMFEHFRNPGLATDFD